MNKLFTFLIVILCVSSLLFHAQPDHADEISTEITTEITIVGGQAADRTEYPWQAMLFNPNGILVCSGTLIHSNWVLTAAHCLDGAGITSVTLGGYDSTHTNEEGRQTFAVKQVILHAGFSPLTLQK